MLPFPTAAVVWPLGTITGRLVAVVASCLLPHICDALNKVALNLTLLAVLPR